MKKILLLLALSVPLYASPAGILDWLGDPSVQPCSGFGCSIPTFLPNANGITTSEYGFGFGPFLEESYIISRQFQVTTAGGFQITNSASVEGAGEQISPIGDIAALIVNFDAVGFGMETTGSAFEPAMPYVPFDAAGGGSPSTWSPITAMASRSDIMTLGMGTYAITQTMDASVRAVNDPTSSINFSTDIVGVDPPDAVPEPHYHLWIIGIAVVARSFIKK